MRHGVNVCRNEIIDIFWKLRTKLFDEHGTFGLQTLIHVFPDVLKYLLPFFVEPAL